MSSTIVTTVGGSTSNSYVSVTEANTYFGDRLGATTWTSATDSQKAQALLQAALHVDSQKFFGRKRYDLPQESTNYQAMEWPRLFLTYAEVSDDYQYTEQPSLPEGHWQTNSSGDPVIPTEVKNAQMEQALFLLKNSTGQVDRSNLRSQGVSSFSLGGYSEVLGRGGGSLLCYEAKMLLRKFLKRGGELARA